LNDIATALVSVSDRRGLAEFAGGLVERGIEIIATGGTASFLRESSIDVREISEITGRVEFLGGLVKTLHPAVHAGILADRSDPRHLEELDEHGWKKIDMVVVNFYPVAGEGPVDDLGFMDIGGPSLARAAAKNLRSCVVVTDPSYYGRVLEEIRAGGGVSDGLRWELAGEAVALTSFYDCRIADVVRSGGRMSAFARHMTFGGGRLLELRYGENPHQEAGFYSALEGGFEVLKGELSYNNILDMDACVSQLSEFGDDAAVVVKHVCPCGVARAARPEEALRAAFECDPRSAFGGVIGLSSEFDEGCAAYLKGKFVECIVAPSFSDAALAKLRKKKKTRLVAGKPAPGPGVHVRSALGGLLAQTPDDVLLPGGLEFVAGDEPDAETVASLEFAWAVAKYVKSNSIVLARGLRTIGIGAGQHSRIDAAVVAARKARDHGHDTRGSVMASDGFFPFPDCIELAHENGVKAVIQPGGSIRDGEVIERAKELGLVMAFTSTRHFRH